MFENTNRHTSRAKRVIPTAMLKGIVDDTRGQGRCIARFAAVGPSVDQPAASVLLSYEREGLRLITYSVSSKSLSSYMTIMCQTIFHSKTRGCGGYSVIDFNCLNLMLDQPLPKRGRIRARVCIRHLGRCCARLQREWME